MLNDVGGGQIRQILNLLDEQNVSASDLQALFRSGLLADLLLASSEAEGVDRHSFRKLIGFLPESSVPVGRFSLSPGQDLAALERQKCAVITSVKEISRSDSVTLGDFEAVLFSYGRTTWSKVAAKAIPAMGRPGKPWQLPKLEHAISLALAEPALQEEGPIVVLGESFNSSVYGKQVVVLDMDYSECVGQRRLGMRSWDGIWNKSTRFLAVRPL